MLLLYLTEPLSVLIGKMNAVGVMGLPHAWQFITCFFLLALSANDCLFAIKPPFWPI
jgi:hypothetical protein